MTQEVPPDVLNIFCDSFERIKASPKFLDRFYENFFDSSPQIKPFFENVSLTRIKSLLQTSLYWPMLAFDGNETSVARLRVLGALHAKKKVMHRHYNLWLDSLLIAVEECDPGYSIVVDQAWRTIMAFGASIMLGEDGNNPTQLAGSPSPFASSEAFGEEEDE